MKRWLSVMICVLALLSVSVSAMAATGDVLLVWESEFGISSSCGVGDTLYLITSDQNQLLVQRAGEVEYNAYMLEMEKPDDDGSTYRSEYLFEADGTLYLLTVDTTYDEDEQTAEAKLYALTLDGNAVTLTEAAAPDWSVMKGQEGYYFTPELFIPAEGGTLLYYYGDMDFELARLNVADGKIEKLDFFASDLMYNGIAKYKDGKIIGQSMQGDQEMEIVLTSLDIETGAVEEVLRVPSGGYYGLNGMAYDEETDTLFFARGGEIFGMDMETGEFGESISDAPLEIYSNTGAYLLDGGYYAFAGYDAYMIRNLRSGEKKDIRLKIADGCWLDIGTKVYNSFVNEHGEAMVILSHDYGDVEKLVDNMMNRSDDVDVFIVQSSAGSFDTLLQRGYMAELDGSEKLTAMAERMPENLRSQIISNGKLLAMPVHMDFEVARVNIKALEKLGLTVEDLPGSMSELLDFMKDMEGNMPEDGSLRMFDPYVSDGVARNILLMRIFSDYQQGMAAGDDSVSDADMVALLHKLEQIDFTALGQPADEELESEEYSPEYNENGYLFEMNIYSDFGYISDSTHKALALSLMPDSRPILSIQTSMIFVNPFSKNKDLAIEYVEKIMDSMNDVDKYVVFTDVTEPLRNPYFDEAMQYYETYLTELKNQLETAEPADKQIMEENLRYAQEAIEAYKADEYVVTEDEIEWLRAHDDAILIEPENWLYSENAGAAYDLVQQYIDGAIKAEQLMKEIGSKIRMMMLEGY